jgi:flagellar basal-body rod modification protein FlgD
MNANPIGSTNSSSSSTAGTNDALRGLDMDQFLKLMIAELQNQDPLNPMDNSQILEQIGQLRSIGATSQLSDTLGAVLMGQNVTTASSLIDRNVKALTDDGEVIEGKVDRVSIVDKAVKLHMGESTVALSNVSEILP